jgi:GT2 family glycosyltransferase
VAIIEAQRVSGAQGAGPNHGRALLGVVTVTYNSAEVLPDFIESLRCQTYQSFRVYVIDNQSRDSSVTLLQAVSGVDFLITRNEANVGIAEGNNQGIKQALADGCTHILLLNNDTVFGEEMFQRLLQVAISGPYQIVVPKIHYHDTVPTIWCAGGWFVPWRGYPGVHYGADQPDRGQCDVDRFVDYSPTCCMLMIASVFEVVGMMDERYFIYYDDTDFCLRALRRGIKIWYTHKIKMQHKAGSLTGGNLSPFTIRMVARNKVYYVRKNFGWLVCAWTFVSYLAYILGRLLVGSDTWQVYKIKMRAFVEGCRMQVG